MAQKVRRVWLGLSMVLFCGLMLAVVYGAIRLWDSAGTYRVRKGLSFSGTNAAGLAVYVHEATGIEFVALPGGIFHMGSAAGEGDPDEHPQHTVSVDPFLISPGFTVARSRGSPIHRCFTG